MVDLDLLEYRGETLVVRINGEIIYPAELNVSEFYRIESREDAVASFRVPFNAVHLEGSVLSVDDPKFEKRANKKIARLVLGGK